MLCENVDSPKPTFWPYSGFGIEVLPLAGQRADVSVGSHGINGSPAIPFTALLSSRELPSVKMRTPASARCEKLYTRFTDPKRDEIVDPRCVSVGQFSGLFFVAGPQLIGA